MPKKKPRAKKVLNRRAPKVSPTTKKPSTQVRIVLDVVKVKGKRGWYVGQRDPVEEGYLGVYGPWSTQVGAWRASRFAGRLLRDNGQKSQAVLHSRSGRIVTEATFGEDPSGRG